MTVDDHLLTLYSVGTGGLRPEGVSCPWLNTPIKKAQNFASNTEKNKLNIIKIMENGLLNKKIYDKS